MKWKKYTIKTVTDAEDIIISTLYDIGLEGAQIEDKVPLTPLEKEQMFVDILPDGPEDDGIAYLSFFVEESGESPAEEDDGMVDRIHAELDALRSFMDIGEGAVRSEERRVGLRTGTRRSCTSIPGQPSGRECTRRRSCVSGS